AARRGVSACPLPAGLAGGEPRACRPPGLPPGGRLLRYNGGPFAAIWPDMIVLEGAAALSPFRRQRLQDRLQTLVPGLRIEGAWYVYFVQPGAGAPDTAALHRILQAGQAEAPRAAGALSRYVVPRLGTRSPWSSKATELLHGAGLDVARVERGLRLDLTGWPRDPAAQAAAA